MLVIYLLFGAVISLWKNVGGGEVGDSNTCSKMPFLSQKLAV